MKPDVLDSLQSVTMLSTEVDRIGTTADPSILILKPHFALVIYSSSGILVLRDYQTHVFTNIVPCIQVLRRADNHWKDLSW